MKITSPIFLQQAGRAGKTPFAGIKVLFPYADPIIGNVSGNGDITITSVKNGEKISNTYSDPNNLTVSVQADANTWVIITGEITKFKCSNYYVERIIAYNNTALTYLSCINCPNLTVLDLKNNTALEELECGDCPGLTALDLSTNTELARLRCDGCYSLTSLNLGENTALTYLECYNCPGLTALDLSNNTELEELYCHNCPNLTALDLSNNTALTDLECYNCPGLTALDLSNNTSLDFLNCHNCPNLTSLDLSNNTELAELVCDKCTVVNSIKYAAENEDVSTSIAELITANEALDGTVYTDSKGEYYSIIADAATAAGWTIAQL